MSKKNKNKKNIVTQVVNKVVVKKFCEHWRDPVKVGEYTVYASELKSGGKIEDYKKEPMPELGVYLTYSWASKLSYFISAGKIEGPKEDLLWPYVAADWPDMGSLPNLELASLLAFTTTEIKKGKRVEIACFGGHGRTGTFIAMLRVILGKMKAADAINTLRDDYCNHAVEAQKQIDAIYALANEKVPEVGAPSPYKSAINFGGWGKSYNLPAKGVYTNYCEDCKHSQYSHDRAEEDYTVEGCADGKWKDETPWSCECKGFKGKRIEDKKEEEENTTTFYNQFPFDKISPIDDGFGLEIMTDEEMIKQFPNDICECKHTRAHHPGGHCTNCMCSLFDLDVVVA